MNRYELMWTIVFGVIVWAAVLIWERPTMPEDCKTVELEDGHCMQEGTYCSPSSAALFGTKWTTHGTVVFHGECDGGMSIMISNRSQ